MIYHFNALPYLHFTNAIGNKESYESTYMYIAMHSNTYVADKSLVLM